MQVQEDPRIERALMGLLAALTFMPALLVGAVHPETQVGLLALSATAIALLVVYRRGRPHRDVLVPRLLGLAMALGLAATLFQLVPLPLGLLRVLDPKASELRALADESGTYFSPISLAPWASVLEVAKQLACMAVFLVAANFLHRANRALPVARMFVLVGVVLASIGLLQRAVHAKSILGLYRPDWWTGFMATFVDPNHAAGFFLLVIGVGLGTAMSAEGRLRLAILAALTVPILTLLLTRSRGGMGGLALLLLAFLLVGLHERKARREALLVGSGLGVIALICFLASFDAIQERLTQAIEHPVANAKVKAWNDALTMTFDFPWTGVGRGAFVDVFPHFNRLNRDVTITHAENLPLQAIADWGYPVGIVATGLVLAALIVLIRNRHLDALARGILAGICALLFQNLFDFNLEFGGTAIPACIFLGILVARSAAHTTRTTHRPAALPAAPTLTAAAITCAAWTLLALPASRYALRAQETSLRRLVATATHLQPAARVAEAAVAHHPVDYQSHLLAGTLYTRFGDGHGMRHLNVAMVLNPSSPAPHLAAARALAASGRRSQAALEYRAAFECGWPMYDAQLGEVLQRSGSTEVALHAIPQTSDAGLSFAGYLERHGDSAGARIGYGHLLDLSDANDPGRLEALRALLRLQDPRQVELAQDLLHLTQLAGDVPPAVAALQRAGRADLAEQALVVAAPRFTGDWSVVAPAADVLVKRGELVNAAQALQTFVDSTADRGRRIAALEKLVSVQEALGQHERALESRYLARQLRALETSQ